HATLEVEVPVVVEPAGVARSVPAIGGEDVGALLLVEPEHQRVAAHAQLTQLAGGERLSGDGINDAVLDAGHGPAERTRLLRWKECAVVVDGVRPERLGHAE